MDEYERIAQRIDTIYARLSAIDPEQTFLIAQLANYTCILSSAYLERAIAEIVVAYCSSRSTPTVTAFASAQIGRFQNPTVDRIERTLGSFGEPVRSRLATALTDETRSSIDSVVNNRNNLAHGRNATVTFSMLKGWDVRIRGFVFELRTTVLS